MDRPGPASDLVFAGLSTRCLRGTSRSGARSNRHSDRGEAVGVRPRPLGLRQSRRRLTRRHATTLREAHRAERRRVDEDRSQVGGHVGRPREAGSRTPKATRGQVDGRPSAIGSGAQTTSLVVHAQRRRGAACALGGVGPPGLVPTGVPTSWRPRGEPSRASTLTRPGAPAATTYATVLARNRQQSLDHDRRRESEFRRSGAFPTDGASTPQGFRSYSAGWGFKSLMAYKLRTKRASDQRKRGGRPFVTWPL